MSELKLRPPKWREVFGTAEGGHSVLCPYKRTPEPCPDTKQGNFTGLKPN